MNSVRRKQYRTRVDDVAWAGSVRSSVKEQEGPPVPPDLQRERDRAAALAYHGKHWSETDPVDEL